MPKTAKTANTAKKPETPKTILASEYLVTPKGKRAVADFVRRVKDLGRDSAEKSGWKYCLAYELSTCLVCPGATSSFVYFPVSASILDAKPKTVADSWMDWTCGETAGNILGGNDDAYADEVRYAFAPWSMDESWTFLDVWPENVE